MLYQKNLPGWERVLRIGAGLALIIYGVIFAPSMLIAASALTSAVVVVVTGFFGYCPACALAGRKPIGQTGRKDTAGGKAQ